MLWLFLKCRSQLLSKIFNETITDHPTTFSQQLLAGNYLLLACNKATNISSQRFIADNKIGLYFLKNAIKCNYSAVHLIQTPEDLPNLF